MKLRNKILLGSSLLAVVPVVLTGALVSGLSTQLAERSLSDQTREQLTTITELKRERVDDYLRVVQGQLQTFSRDPSVVVAMHDLRASFLPATPPAADGMQATVSSYYTDRFAGEMQRRGAASVDMERYFQQLTPKALAMQYYYAAANESPLGAKFEMDESADDTTYSVVYHVEHHHAIREFMQSAADISAYEDLYFIDEDTGQVVYSVGKSLEFGTSLQDGPFADSGLADVYRGIVDSTGPDDVVFADFESYVPAFGEPSAFFATPVFEGETRIGVLAARISADRINDIMTSSETWRQVGLRETGETYLVGPDGTLRNDSRFLVEEPDGYLEALSGAGVTGGVLSRIRATGSSILAQPARTPAVDAALAGERGFARGTDYRGEPVFVSYLPVSALGVDWALVAQFDEAEALGPVAELRDSVLMGSGALGLGVLVVGGAAGWMFTRTVTRPVRYLEDTVRQVAGGDDGARARMTTGDELQTLGDAFDSLLDERIARYERAAAENERLNNSVIELLMAVSKLSQHDLTVKVPVTEDVTGPVADALNEMVSEIAQLLTDASGVAERVGTASTRLREQADAIRELAEAEGQEVDRMADELEAAARTMDDIADLAQRCDDIAAETSKTTGTALETVTGTVEGMGVIRELVHETEKRIKRLGERSQEISGIVDIINTIAERTHVLALNAAMQAAAAGESGRGFAVVADEVQRLAESSRNATSQISGLVHNIQVETSDTISTMGRTITEVVEGSRLAEQAGEQMQQTRSTTNDLVTAVQEIARGSQYQSATSQQLLEKAASVQLSTRRTREQVEEQSVQTRALVADSGHLIESIGAFTLPPRLGVTGGADGTESDRQQSAALAAAGGSDERSSGT